MGRNTLFFVVLLIPSVARAPLFDSPIDGGPSAWFKTIVEHTGFKALAEGTKAVELALSRDGSDARLKRIVSLDQNLKVLREEKIKAAKNLEELRKKVLQDVSKLRSTDSTSDASGDDVACKLKTLYEERLQNINGALGIWATVTGILEGHITTLQNQPEEIMRVGADLIKKTFYSIDDIHYLDAQIEETEELVKQELLSRKAVAKERTSLQERLGFLSKGLELKTKELEALKLNKSYVPDASGDSALLSRNDSCRVLQEQLDLEKDRIILVELKIKKLDLEQAVAEDVVAALKIRAARLNALFAKIKRNLVIDAEDVARAKADKYAQELIFSSEKERIRRVIHEKTFERERIREHHESCKAVLYNLRGTGKEASHEGYVAQARESLDRNLIKALDAQISLLGLDDDFAHVEADIKRFEFKSLDIRYRLVTEDSRIGSWLEEIVNSKRLLENDLAKYQAQGADANSSIAHMQEEADRLKKKQAEILDQGATVFLEHEDSLRSSLQFLADAKDAVRLQISQAQKFVARSGEVLKLYQRLLKQYLAVIGELEVKRVNVNIWQRSARGISLSMAFKAVDDAQNFSKNLFWKTHDFFDPTGLMKKVSFKSIFGLFLFALIYWLGFLVSQGLLAVVRRRIQLFASYQKGNFVFWHLNVILLFFDAAQRQFSLFYALCFVYLQIKLRISYYGVFSFANEQYALAGFYLISLGIWTYLCVDFLAELRLLNIRLSYFFFSDRNQRRIMSLLSLLLHSTAFVFPLRSALLAYGLQYENLLGVLFAGYSLIVLVSLSFLFDKDDFLSLIVGRSGHWLFIRDKIELYFYPGFFFIVLLFILANPYVGYSQLAWYLAFFVPISMCVVVLAIWMYGAMRKQVLWIFIDERDDEMTERFEYAKVYYGFFVTLTFFGFLFLLVGVLSQIWGLPYNFAKLWTAVSEDWVVSISSGRLGILEFIIIYTFVVGGYLASTFGNRFVLNKIFEVFGADPGTQNTFSRIFHIIFLVIAFVLGSAFIGFGGLVLPGLLYLIALALFSSKDLLADFVAGLLILLERQIEIGHYVFVEGHRGVVHKISARSTTVRTSQNYFLVVPNRNLISHAIVNWGAGRYSVGFELIINTGFENDPDVILEILRRVMNAHPSVLRVPAIVTRLENFTPQGADYFVRAFVSIRKVKDQWDILGDLRVAIYKAFREKGIVFPYPRFVMYQNNNKPDDASTFFKMKFDSDSVAPRELD